MPSDAEFEVCFRFCLLFIPIFKAIETLRHCFPSFGFGLHIGGKCPVRHFPDDTAVAYALRQQTTRHDRTLAGVVVHYG